MRDNTMYSDNHAFANGAGMGLFCGVTGGGHVRRALLYFNISAQLPAGAVVASARLTLHSTRTNSDVFTAVAVHRMLRAWGEGSSIAPGFGGSGAPATAADATWLYAFFGAEEAWTTPGGDFADIPAAITEAAPFGPVEFDLTEAVQVRHANFVVSLLYPAVLMTVF